MDRVTSEETLITQRKYEMHNTLNSSGNQPKKPLQNKKHTAMKNSNKALLELKNLTWDGSR